MEKKSYKKTVKIAICLIIVLILINIQGFSQNPVIWAPSGTEQIATTYSNQNIDPDPIFIFCAEASEDSIGELYVTGGYYNCTYTWGCYDIDPTSPTYNQFVTIQDWASGFTDNISNLPSGLYQVIVNCGGNTTCARAHVFVNESIVEFDAIAAGCDTFSINGAHIDAVDDFTIYEPPPNPFIVDSLTEIKVCFSANHTYVSDLGFYLVAPDGVTTVELLPSIAAWNNSTTLDASQVLLCNSNEVNTNCNSGNNVDEFCFSTGPINNGLPTLIAGNPNQTACICNMSTPLSGTFASAGPWSPLWLDGSFNAADDSWAVQIYDCIGADVGFFSEVSITFKGQSDCGLTTIDYDSGPINSTINDNSCDPATASIYVVPLKSTSSYALHDSVTATWSCSPVNWDPAWGSQDFNTNPSPHINPEPSVSTTFSLTIADHLYDTLGNEITAYTPCNPSVTNTYITLPTDASILSFPSEVCKTDPPVLLIPAYYGGVWEVIGSNACNSCLAGGGYFFPSQANIGTNEICYSFGGICPSESCIIIDVLDTPTANAGLDQQICGETVQLMADTMQNYFGVGAWNASVAVNWAASNNIPNPTVSISDFLTNANNNPINTYVVFTWTITNGPCSHSDDVSVTFKPIPTAFAGNDTSVCGLTVDLNAIYSLGGPPASYGNWTSLGYFGGSSNNDPNASLTVYNYGQYTFIWRENNEECFDQDYVTIEFLQNPPIPTITHSGDSLITLEGYICNWYLNGNLLPEIGHKILALASGEYFVEIINENGCSSVSNLYEIIVVGIENENFSKHFKIYPNPNNGNFFVEIKNTNSSNIDVKIHNVLGEIVYFEQVSSLVNNYKNSINLCENLKGVYFVTVKTEENVFVRRLVLQ